MNVQFIRAATIVVLLLGASFHCAAQSTGLNRAKELDEVAERLVAEDKVADAVLIAEEALAIRSAAYGQNHPELLSSLHFLAKLYNDEGRRDDEGRVLVTILMIQESMLPFDPMPVVDSLTKLAKFNWGQGNGIEVEALYRKAIGITQQKQGEDHLDTANLVHELAVFYYFDQQYKKSEEFYRKALAIKNNLQNHDKYEIAELFCELGDVYVELGDDINAERHYASGISIFSEIAEISYKEKPERVSNLIVRASGFIKFYSLHNKYKELLPYLKFIEFLNQNISEHDSIEAANAMSYLSKIYYHLGLYADSEKLQRRALLIRENNVDDNVYEILGDLNGLALIYKAQGRHLDAEAILRRALETTEKAFHPNHHKMAEALHNIADVFYDQKRYSDAKPIQQRAVLIYEKNFGPNDPRLGQTLRQLALIDDALGKISDADMNFKRAAVILEDFYGTEHLEVSSIYVDLAKFYKEIDHFSEAETLYDRALGIREKALGQNHPQVASVLAKMARFYLSQGNFAAALPASIRSVEVLERHFSGGESLQLGGGAPERQKFRPDFIDHVALIDVVARKDSTLIDAPERTFRAAQLAQRSGAGEAVAGMAARFAAGSDTLAAAVRDRQDLADRLQRFDAESVKMLSRPPAGRNAAEEARLREALVEAGKRVEALDARIASDFPQYAELSAPKPLTSDATRALLAPDEALLVYLVAEQQSWLWALRGDKIELHRIDVGFNQLKGEVQSLRQALDPTFNPRLTPFPATRAYELHQKILAPATSLLTGAKHVFIVPDGALESLPIGVLVTKPPKDDPDDPVDHREIAWFARDHAITVLPSVSSLRALRQFSNAARASKPFLGIGNPTLEGQPGKVRGVQLASLFRGALADVDAVRKLDPLPETADELRTVAKSRGAVAADLLLADRATEPQIRASALDAYQVVHFATHGLVVGELRGLSEPALVLTPPAKATPEDDGLLTASKVATLKLNADWVVLSACNTAAGDGTPGAGGLSGLAKAFFYAGARSLLVSHWSVPSEATVKLVTGAFDALGKEPGIGRAEALRRSQMAMLDPSAKPEFAHPLFWAPFVLAGEGGAGR